MCDIYIRSIFVSPWRLSALRHGAIGILVNIPQDFLSSCILMATRTLDETDDLPPPYSLNPTDEVSLEFGPPRPFQRPPQQPRPHHHPPQRPQRQPQRELSDFARDFYAAGDGPSRSAQDLPHRTPPQQPQTQNSVPDDGRPTRTPVPGHPLLNNGKTLVYPAGYECYKCLSRPLSLF